MLRPVAALLFALTLHAQGLPAAKPITVSAAVSLSDALSAIGAQYGKDGHGSIRFNFGASNVLARQITRGTRVDLLRNQLAIVVPNDRPRTLTGPRELTAPAFRRIAIGDPAAVPAGVYAKQYLEQLDLWTAIEPKAVPSASVRAALAAVES